MARYGQKRRHAVVTLLFAAVIERREDEIRECWFSDGCRDPVYPLVDGRAVARLA
jgi:hypothetical protein